ncbi:hypothetical protein glysoja_022734 [Glycine soja]|nr:hypothetical protein glysoja_022734 [Glycine soja]
MTMGENLISPNVVTRCRSRELVKHAKYNIELNQKGAARTQAPTTTNYDVGSPTWGDLRWAPLQSAMEVTNLGHGHSRSSIDPIQAAVIIMTP